MHTPQPFSTNDDTYSLEDAQTRYEQLTEERNAIFADAGQDPEDGVLNEYDHPEACAALDDWDADNEEELAQLQSIIDQVDTSAFDNQDTLINKSYFEDYCRELVEDIGAVPQNLPAYIANNIDWEGVAADLSVDYSTVKLGGVTFYYRSC